MRSTTEIAPGLASPGHGGLSATIVTSSDFRLWNFLSRRRGGPCVAASFYAIAGTLAVSVGVAAAQPELSVPAFVTICATLTNGPWGPLLPGVFEPILAFGGSFGMTFSVAFAALVGTVSVEIGNWYAYRWLLDQSSVQKACDSRMVRWGERVFSHCPFVAVVLFAVTPLPFFVGRVLAILRGYPLGWFLLATAAGRFPRYLALAALGQALGLKPTHWVGLAAVLVATGALRLAAKHITPSRVSLLLAR